LSTVAGNDALLGGIFAGSSPVTDAGFDRLFGENGDDNLVAATFGTVVADGGAGNDDLTGFDGDDVLNTRDDVRGNDEVNGRGGRNTCTIDPGDVVFSCIVV
jgi:hypothetical protein